MTPQQQLPTSGRGHGCQCRASERQGPRCHQIPQSRVQDGCRAKRDGARLGRCRAGDGVGGAMPGSPGQGQGTMPAGGEPRAAAVQEGDGGRVRGPSASPAPAPQCWAGRREGREGSSKGTLVSDEGSPLTVGLVLLTVRLRGALLLPDVGGEPLVGDNPAVQSIDLHTPQTEA